MLPLTTTTTMIRERGSEGQDLGVMVGFCSRICFSNWFKKQKMSLSKCFLLYERSSDNTALLWTTRRGGPSLKSWMWSWELMLRMTGSPDRVIGVFRTMCSLPFKPEHCWSECTPIRLALALQGASLILNQVAPHKTRNRGSRQKAGKVGQILKNLTVAQVSQGSHHFSENAF